MPDRLSERLARVRSRRRAPTVRMDPVTVMAERPEPSAPVRPEESVWNNLGVDTSQPDLPEAPGKMTRLHERLLEISRATSGSRPFGPLTPKGVTAAPTDAPENVSAGELLTGAGTGAIDLAGRVAAALEAGGNPSAELAGVDQEEPAPVIPGIRRKLLGMAPEPATPGAAVSRGVGHAAGFMAPFMVGGGAPALVAGSALNAASEVGSEPEESMAGMLEKAGILPEGASQSGLARAGVALAGDVATVGTLSAAGRGIRGARAARARPIETPSPARQAIERAKASIAQRRETKALELARERPTEVKTVQSGTPSRKVTREEIFSPENKAKFGELSTKPVPKANQELRARIAAGEDLTDAEVHQAEPEYRTIYDALEVPHPAKPETSIGAQVKRDRIRQGDSDVPVRAREEPVDLDQAVTALERTRQMEGGAEFGDVSDVIDGLKRDARRAPLTAGRVRTRIAKAITDHGKSDARARGVDLKNEGVVTIIAGPPGSGKSTIANQLGHKTGSYVVDSDPAKLRDPRYSEIGANGVHNESSAIADNALQLALNRRENVIVPLVGKSEAKLRGFMEQLTSRGYKVHYVLADLHPEEASVRAFNRGIRKGRNVAPDYVLNAVASRPQETFDKLKLVTDITGGRYARLDQSHPPDIPLNARLTEHGPGFDPELLREHAGGTKGLRRARTDRHLAQVRRSGEPAPGGRERRRLSRAAAPAQVQGKPLEEVAAPVTPAPAAKEPPALVASSSKLPGLAGEDDVVTIGDRRLKVRHRVVEARDLVPSNNPANSFERDARYPKEIQGRVYSGEAGRGARERVVEMAGKMEPAGLTLPSRSVHGSPIVTEKGHAIVGNQRVMAWQMTEQNPVVAARLKAQVVKDAAKLGIDPAEVEGMQHPMVVRELADPTVRADDYDQLAKLNQLSDVSTGKAKDPRVEAAGRARQMARSPAALDHFADTISPDETINEYLRGKNGPEMLNRLVKGEVIRTSELDQFRDASSGKLTKFGRERIQEMIQGAAVGGDPAVLDRAPESVLAKLDQSWPRAVKAEGIEGWSLEDPLKSALSLHGQRVDNGASSIDDVVGQSDMFGREAKAESKGVTLAKFLEDHKKAEVTAAFQEYATAAEGAKGAGAADDMFGHKPESASAAFRRIFGGPEEKPPSTKVAGTINYHDESARARENIHESVGGFGRKRRAGAIGNQPKVSYTLDGDNLQGRLTVATREGDVIVVLNDPLSKTPHVEFIGFADRMGSKGFAVERADENRLGPAAMRQVLRETRQAFGLEGKEISGMRVGGARATAGDTESYAHFRMGSGRGRSGMIGSVAGDAAQDPHNIAAVKMLASIAGGGVGAAGGAAAPGTPEEKKARAVLGLAVGLTAPFAPEIIEQLATRIRGVAAETPAKIFRIRHSAEEGIRVTIQGQPDKEQLGKLLALYNNKPGSKFGFSIRDLQGREVGKGDSIIQLYADLPWSESNAARVAPKAGVLGNQPDMFGHVEKPPAADDLFGDADVGKAAVPKGQTFDKRQAEAITRYEFLVKQLKRMPEGPARTKVAREVADLAKIANYDQKIGYDEGRARIAAGDDLFARTGAIGNQPRKTLPAPTPTVQSAFDEVAKGIDFSGRLAKGMKGSQRTLSTRIQKFSDAIANANGPIERLGELSGSRPARNPRELLTFAKSSDATVKRAFEEGVLDPKTREIVGPSYNSIFEPVAGDDDALEKALTYIVSKRMVGRGPSSTGGDKAKFAAMQQVVKHGDADPILSDVAERWGNYTNALGEYAVKSKMWTPELWQAMKDSDVLYVRVKRLMDPAAAPPMGRSSRGFGNVGPGVDRFSGSARAMENPAEAMAEYTRQIIHRSDRYAVGHAMMDAVDDMGPAGELIMSKIPSNSPAAKFTISESLKNQLPLAPADVLEEVSRMFDPKLSRLNPVLWRNAEDGGKEFRLVQAPELWSSIMQLNAQDQGAVRKFLDVTVRPLKRIFTATTTGWSPRFSLATNPSRDIPTALAQTQANLRPDQIARGYAEAIAALAGGSDVADEASRFGLTGVSIFAQDKPAVVARGFTRGARAKHVARRVVAAPVTALEAAGTASDLGPRLGEYMAAQRKFAPKVASGEWTQWEANLRSSTLGRGVTLDFTNRPGNPVLKLFADYVPFFGVGLQAPKVAVQSLVRNPARYLTVLGAGGATAATVAWILKHQVDEETRQQINDRSTTERSGFLYVPTTSGGPILKVPLGQEMGIVVNGVTAALDKWMDDDPNAASLFMQTLARALPNGLDAAARGVIPIPGIQQIQENRANERVFGGRPVEPRRMEGLPAAERRYDTTAPTFDMLAAGARKVGFGAMDSPLKAENAVRGVTSMATPFITAAVDPLASRVMGREGKKRIPIGALRHPLNPASAFVAAVPAGGTQSTEAFYDLKTELEQATNQKRAVYKAKDRDGLRRLRKEYGELLQPGVKTVMDQADDRLTQLKDREAEIRGRHDRAEISDEEAKDALKSVTTRRQVMLRRVVTVLRQHGVTP